MTGGRGIGGAWGEEVRAASLQEPRGEKRGETFHTFWVFPRTTRTFHFKEKFTCSTHLTAFVAHVYEDVALDAQLVVHRTPQRRLLLACTRGGRTQSRHGTRIEQVKIAQRVLNWL